MVKIRINPNQGPQGPPGPGTEIDASGATAGRANYDAELPGFVYADTSVSPFLISIRETTTAGVWSPWGPIQGPQGVQGATGPAGAKGDAGATGAPGDDAYQIALQNGFVGTEADWLASLEGAQGPTGTTGATGATGDSAYQVWLAQGNVGTEADYIIDITGPQGAAGVNGTNWKPDATGLISERSAYDAQAKDFAFFATDEGNLYVKNSATNADWSAAIPYSGPEGPIGPTGPQGIQGPAGPGVAAGGTAGQILVKSSVADYDTAWQSPPPWIDPTLLNGWTNIAGRWATAGYYKDLLGQVHLRGLVTGGTVSTTTTGDIFVLPVGYRPLADASRPTLVAGETLGRTDILSDGSVRAHTGAAGGYWSLAGISFRAEQ